MDKVQVNTVPKTLDIMFDPRLTYQRKIQAPLEYLVGLMGSKNGSVMSLEGDCLIVSAATRRKLVGMRQKLSRDSIAGRAVATGKALKVDDYSRDPDISGLARRPAAKGSTMFISAPVFGHQGVVGVLNISDKKNGKPYTVAETETLGRWVRRISPILETAKLTHDLQQEQKRLRHANRELKKLEAMKRDLMNMIVHDMKGPLNEISANLDLITAHQLDDLARSYLESAELGALSLSQLIGNLLNVSRMEEGKMPLHLVTFDAVALAEDALRRFKTLLSLNNLKAKVMTLEERPMVTADRDLIERALGNLLTNAAEHSPIGGSVKVTVALHRDRGMVEFRVRDEGEGVPEPERENIFKKFFQAPGVKTSHGGSGLGLAFCDRAIRAHRGRIWVTSKVNEGSEFCFEIPLDTATALEAARGGKSVKSASR
ncbi:MAG: GAF domain-containing sensor histidine kinase [Nitrospinae bacterium]|nr:GAF domain-containing sensor histidine kinase [Nitrospinota bacterium]